MGITAGTERDDTPPTWREQAVMAAIGLAAGVVMAAIGTVALRGPTHVDPGDARVTVQTVSPPVRADVLPDTVYTPGPIKGRVVWNDPDKGCGRVRPAWGATAPRVVPRCRP